jgi:hypothetical protein
MISEQLRAARQLLVDEGWWQAGPGAAIHRGRNCTLMAAYWQAERDDQADLRDRLYAYLCQAIGTQSEATHTIARWNDTPGRTLDQVLAAYDRAIDLAEHDEIDAWVTELERKMQGERAPVMELVEA